MPNQCYLSFDGTDMERHICTLSLSHEGKHRCTKHDIADSAKLQEKGN